MPCVCSGVDDLYWIADAHADGVPPWDDESRRVYAALDEVRALLKQLRTRPAGEPECGSTQPPPGTGPIPGRQAHEPPQLGQR